MVSPLCNISSEGEQQVDDLVMSLQASQQQRSSAIHVTIIRFMTACMHQYLHAVNTVTSSKTNNTFIFVHHDFFSVHCYTKRAVLNEFLKL